MEWSDVRIFLAVARQGSLGAAARTLGLSHPTVGRRVRALEEDTGHPLLQRHQDGVLLTDAGTRVFRLAEEMEASALAIERRLSGADGKTAGPLRISSADWFATYVLPPVIETLLHEHPGIEPELLVSSRRYDLSRREADVVFRVVPFEEPGVVQCRLLRIDYGLYARDDADMPARGDGRGTKVVLMDTSVHRYPEVDWLREVLPHAQAVATTNHRALQARLCQRGMGLAVLPCAVGDTSIGLKRLDVGDAPPSRHIWMGYHEDMRGMDRVRALADIATRLLGGEAEHS
ncbi:LysR family transcriptional regulator [Luteibacter anthropi]|uniref:LysR family transcriptional regulator n=1 Tax=Luteibacter anthropi TaxID=564369 RepID=UPI0020331340|nr:LysR family transcriptional regulator [Luteibacter anthropi]URX63231.1 LysR family transcriptional regulator [Luteibacter anthropi]